MVLKQKTDVAILSSTKVWRALVDKGPISVAEAEKIVLQNLFSPGIERCSIHDATGRILAKNIVADRDFPPFHRVAMDGIAINFEAFASGQKRLELVGIQSAGTAPFQLTNSLTCVEVMTGAVLPHGADTVIRYEDLKIADGMAEMRVDDIRLGQNVHHLGTDRKTGDLLIPKNTRIRPAEIGVLATVGSADVPVYKRPSVAIISTGNELVDVNETPLPHQIRKSNVFMLQSMLQTHGITPTIVHISDDKSLLEKTIPNLLSTHDVTLFSGAVSKGKFDFLPEVLNLSGVKKHFHLVQQRPGKPFWFGSNEQTTVFAFPGNPVSTAICAVRYLIPWMHRSYHQKFSNILAQLTSDVTFKPPLQYFLPVTTAQKGGEMFATPCPGHGSGDLANLIDANGWLELPADVEIHRAGSLFPYWSWK